MVFQRFGKIVNLHFGGVAGIVHAPSGIDQVTVGVEDIEMRRPQCTIGKGHRLGLVVQVDPWKMVLFHPLNHVIKRIIGIRVAAIGIDANETDSLRGESFGRLAGNLVGTHHIRTVVAGEEDDQNLGLFEVGQIIGATIRGG